MNVKIPIIVLGGSDRRHPELPDPTGEGHPATGCKGVDVRLGGRYLIDVLADRLRRFFDPVYVAGPLAAYRVAEIQHQVIDTDGGFGRNIQAGLETGRQRHPGSALAMCTCDILPEPRELEGVLADYRGTAPSDLWFPIISIPNDPEALGPSAWKPQYFVVPRAQQPAVRVLPSHLVIFDPDAIRRRFLYRLLDLAYRTRNRPIGYRRSYLLRKLLASLVLQDLRLLFRLQLPTLTWEVAGSGIVAARKLKERVVLRHELEDALRKIFVKRRHRRRFPERRFLVPILDALSLARDIDTVEEALALGGTPASAATLEPGPAASPATRAS